MHAALLAAAGWQSCMHALAAAVAVGGSVACMPARFWLQCWPCMHPNTGVPVSAPVLGALLQVGEEVRVLAAEGLRPADLIQELLLLR